MQLYPTSNQTEYPIGIILASNGAPGSGWALCDGSNYLKSNYPVYVANCFDLHPLRFQTWKKFWFTNTPNVQIRSVAINGAIAVMVGGTTRYHWRSTDSGETWTEYSTNLPASGDWRIVRYANSQFVAVVYGSTQAAYSSDGITWTTVTLPASGNWKYLYWDGTQWILTIGAGSGYCTSSNGSSWTSRTGIPFHSYSGIAVDLNNNELMIINNSDSPYAYHSTDAITWTQKKYFQYELRPYETGAYPTQVMYFPDSDKWIFLTDSISYSPNSGWESYNDGVDWTSIYGVWRFDVFSQDYYGGVLWDGDCNIWFKHGSYTRGYYMKDGNSPIGFSAVGYGASNLPTAFDAQYERYLLLPSFNSGESTFNYYYKYYYGDYDPQTRFCVPNLTSREVPGIQYYVRLQ